MKGWLAAGEGIILKKNKDGMVIGIEKHYLSKTIGMAGKSIDLYDPL